VLVHSELRRLERVPGAEVPQIALTDLVDGAWLLASCPEGDPSSERMNCLDETQGCGHSCLIHGSDIQEIKCNACSVGQDCLDSPEHPCRLTHEVSPESNEIATGAFCQFLLEHRRTKGLRPGAQRHCESPHSH
jgi:hypothetical protein